MVKRGPNPKRFAIALGGRAMVRTKPRARSESPMLLKASIVMTLAVCAVAALSRVDYRELYNEMYPVNGLRRDLVVAASAAELRPASAGDQDILTAFGLPRPARAAAAARDELPVLSLGGAGDSGGLESRSFGAALLDQATAADLGGDSVPR